MLLNNLRAVGNILFRNLRISIAINSYQKITRFLAPSNDVQRLDSFQFFGRIVPGIDTVAQADILVFDDIRIPKGVEVGASRLVMYLYGIATFVIA